jgi:hypothetical protein
MRGRRKLTDASWISRSEPLNTEFNLFFSSIEECGTTIVVIDEWFKGTFGKRFEPSSNEEHV